MILRLAWKNIWRNKLRSATLLGAIAIGLFAGTFMTAFIAGWMENTVVTDINNELSYIQVHKPGYDDNQDIGLYFSRAEVEQQVKSVPSVLHTSYRLKINGMIASAVNAAGVSIKGVDVADEKATTDLYKTIPDSCGSFFAESGKMQIVLSKKTAEKLKVRLKSKVVITFQNVNGEVQSLAFRVGGIFKTTNTQFDESTVFVRNSDLLPYAGLPEGTVHEAAIKVKDMEACEKATLELQKRLPGLEVQSWDKIQPALGIMLSWTNLINFIILSIFLLALSFGIVNTMLMAVLERTRELGMLACIGMSKKKLFRMIMSETLFITFIGSLAGIVLALGVIGLTAKSGIDLTFMLKDQFEDYGFGSIVYPILNVKMFAEIVGLVAVAGILSAIYPARKALKLNPLDAVKQ